MTFDPFTLRDVGVNGFKYYMHIFLDSLVDGQHKTGRNIIVLQKKHINITYFNSYTFIQLCPLIEPKSNTLIQFQPCK